MADFSEIPWIAEHIRLYRTDPERAHMWDSVPLGGPGILPTLLLTTRGRKSGEPRALPLIYGTVGDSYVVIALEDGFEFDGRRYRSLSKIAREITGTRWSGPLFFGLKKRTDVRANHGE